MLRLLWLWTAWSLSPGSTKLYPRLMTCSWATTLHPENGIKSGPIWSGSLLGQRQAGASSKSRNSSSQETSRTPSKKSRAPLGRTLHSYSVGRPASGQGQIGVVHPATVPFAETLVSLWVTYLERPMSSLRASATIAMHRVMVEPRGTGMSMSSSGSHTTLRWRGQSGANSSRRPGPTPPLTNS